MIVFAVNLTGCALLDGGETDTASGSWEGHWYVGESTSAAGVLNCEIERVDKDEWKAVFYAEFGGEATYNVELSGRRGEGAVVFGGKVDLGQTSGGVFDWGGEADGVVFKGKYTSQFINGWFEMKKVE